MHKFHSLNCTFTMFQENFAVVKKNFEILSLRGRCNVERREMEFGGAAGVYIWNELHDSRDFSEFTTVARGCLPRVYVGAKQ